MLFWRALSDSNLWYDGAEPDDLSPAKMKMKDARPLLAAKGQDVWISVLVPVSLETGKALKIKPFLNKQFDNASVGK